MIRITFSQAQTALAEQIRHDLSDSFEPAQPLLIVLISQQSSSDAVVQAEIEGALQQQEQIVPILLENASLPAALETWRPLDLSRGYSRKRLLAHLARETMTADDTRRANRRALALIGAIAMLMFGLAIVAMMGGVVAFPVAEYNEEATFQAQWVDGLIRETLEAVQPRTTEDAQNFAATHAAAPTRLYYYVRGTATALAAEQEG